MTEVINAIGLCFSFLYDTKLLGIPLLVWIVLTCLFTLIGSFIKGKK